MNERIDQLAEQCWTRTNVPLYSEKSRSPHWEFDRHKFAQLMIQECVKCIEDTDNDRVFTAQNAGIIISAHNRSIKKIKEYFGVEE